MQRIATHVVDEGLCISLGRLDEWRIHHDRRMWTTEDVVLLAAAVIKHTKLVARVGRVQFSSIQFKKARQGNADVRTPRVAEMIHR